MKGGKRRHATKELQGVMREETYARTQRDKTDSKTAKWHFDHKPYAMMGGGKRGAGK